ncbi:hypothetical protein MKW94_007905 [Papaver nudicaule]|uniref:RING-type E3 ubiquitin transferase n=1 Tax=Papaver nudicaule TaxID=74823 RepID=A0AA42B3S3_PAPNU|nr:hypothetical protein [Papaver nudicaule]
MVSSLKLVLSYLFIFLFSLKKITCQDTCSSVQCSEAGNEPDIVFPFGNKDLQGEGCGYPGFNLTCNSFDKTVLKLPQSGEFLVRKIDYANKEIRLYDQNNCLARRLQQQNLNVNLLPFKAFAYQSYNFFNCPPAITSNPSALAIQRKLLLVPCLGNPTNTVLVSVSSGSEFDSNITKVLINGDCQILDPVTIPIPFDAINKIYSYDFTTDDLYLTWVTPEKPTTNGNENGDESKDKGKPNWKKIIFITVSVLMVAAVMVFIVVCLVCGCRKGMSAGETLVGVFGFIFGCCGFCSDFGARGVRRPRR